MIKLRGRILFFFTDTATTEIYTLSLHDALPIYAGAPAGVLDDALPGLQPPVALGARSEEHTSELQSRENLVCRLLLEKKNPGIRRMCSYRATRACACA